MESSMVSIPICIDENNVFEGAREILKVIRPSWNQDNIKFKLFTDGITNKLVGCFYIAQHNSPTCQKLNYTPGEKLLKEDVILVRVYGNKTDMLIDRKAETRNIKLLQKYGFAPNLYAVFKNGLAYEYVPGITLTSTTIYKPQIWKLIAKRMAEMHKVNCGTNIPKEANLNQKYMQFYDLLPIKFSNPEVSKRIEKLFSPLSKLRHDFLNLFDILVKLNSPIVFAHNDLLLGNIIYTEELNQVTFIDYEYANYNYQGYDIGNHFTEFAGIDDIDYSRYPNKDFQKQWLKVYLENYLDSDSVNDESIEKLYVQVNQFALASHLLWTVWALIQAEHSTIDFDFVKFAENRYSEYLAKKDQFLSLSVE